MGMQEALQALGVTEQTLTSQQREQLDTLGYVIFYNVIDPAWLEALRAKFEELSAEEGDKAGSEVGQMNGVRRLADLVNKGEVFDRIYTNPLVLAAANHLINRPFKLHSLNGHDPLPGYGQQALHPDWGGERGGLEVCCVINSMWMLDDFAKENGATRVVPGSQRWPGSPREQMADPTGPHPQEIYLEAPAGSVAVFNGHAWHGSRHNSTERKRRVYHGAFIAREFKQQTDQRKYLRPATAERLSPAARWILDVD